MRPVILLDPGHGGSDAGATIRSDSKTIREADIVFDYASLVKKFLEDLGCCVYLTRRSKEHYYGLKYRVYVSYVVQPIAFVSLHANAAGTSVARGFEVYYCPHNSGGLTLANRLYEGIDRAEISSMRGNGGRPETDSQYTRIYVLHYNPVPSALVELGFMTHAGDLQRLLDSSWRWTMCEFLSKAIYDYVAEACLV